MNDYQEWAKRPSAGQRMLLILSAVILLAALFMLKLPVPGKKAAKSGHQLKFIMNDFVNV